MKKANNLYNYAIPKSGNQETSFFLTKGRITSSAFYMRLLLCICIYGLSFLVFNYQFFVVDYNGIFFGFIATLHWYILPFLLAVFVLIQAAKRMHDVNKSGLYFFIPMYGIYLSLCNGTKGNNDYGIDPRPHNNVTYYDELENKEQTNNAPTVSPTAKPNNFLPVIAVAVIFLVVLGVFLHNRNNIEQETAFPAIVDTTAVDSAAAPAVENTKSDNIGGVIWETENSGYFIDERDQNKYRVFKIGNQVWMADNLRYKSPESVSLRCKEENDQYGRLYNWHDANEVAPEGWHLPSRKEYQTLLNNAEKSRMFDDDYFDAYASGTAFLSLAKCNDKFPQYDDYLAYWTATLYGNEVAWALQYYEEGLMLNWSNSYRKGRTETGCYYGVRCVLNKKQIKW